MAHQCAKGRLVQAAAHRHADQCPSREHRHRSLRQGQRRQAGGEDQVRAHQRRPAAALVDGTAGSRPDQGRDRHAQHRDDRRPTPLPAGVACYLLAATTADKPGRMHRALIGDGLVPLASALGEHRDAALALPVPRGHRHVVSGCSHLDLLCHAEVQAQLQRWRR